MTVSKGQREYRAAEYRAKAGDRALIRSHVNELKTAPCSDCGGTFDPVCMDFDHRPGEVKLGEVSALIYGGLDHVLEEIAKCDLVCSNCHRPRTKARTSLVCGVPAIPYGPIITTAERRAIAELRKLNRQTAAIAMATTTGSCSAKRLGRELALSPSLMLLVLNDLVAHGVLAKDRRLGFVLREVAS